MYFLAAVNFYFSQTNILCQCVLIVLNNYFFHFQKAIHLNLLFHVHEFA